MYMEKTSSAYFGKDTTAVIKGVALVMMFYHHFFTFPDWWVEGVSYPLLAKLAPYFCAPLKICGCVFCFLTGYFYFFNQKRDYKYSFRKITDILIHYWFVFFIYAIIAVVAVSYKYTLGNFVKEMFALTTEGLSLRPTMFFCWYVHFFITIMLILPLITKLLGKNIHLDLFISWIGFPLLVALVVRITDGLFNSLVIHEVLCDLVWFSSVLTGFIFARYGLFEKLEAVNKKYIKSNAGNIVLWLLIAIIIPMGRYFAPNLMLSVGGLNYPNVVILSIDDLPMIGETFSYAFPLDVIYTPLFIYSLVNLIKACKLTHLNKVLAVIGKYSLLMWFVHSIFFNNSKSVFQPILYWPKNPVLVLLWGLVLALGVSFVFDIVIKRIVDFKNRYLFK